MQQSHEEKMAFAKMLRQEQKVGTFNDFRSGSVRGRGGRSISKVGGNGPVSVGPRTEYGRGDPRLPAGPYSSRPHSATMTRPMHLSNRNSAPVPTSANAAPKQVDKGLQSFLDGSAGRPAAPGNTASTATQDAAPHLARVGTLSLAPAVSQQTIASTSNTASAGIPPHLTPRAVASHNTAPVRPAAPPEASVTKNQPAAGSVAGEHDKKDHVKHEQSPAPAQRNGLGQSIWAGNDSTTVETPRKNALPVCQSGNGKESKSVLPNIDVDTLGSQSKREKHALFEGNANRMLANLPIAPIIATENSTTPASATKNASFVAIWDAVQEGRNQSDIQDLLRDMQSLPAADGKVMQPVMQSTAVAETAQDIADDPKTCNCPERPRGLHGLSSSMFNVDEDGDKSLTDPQKFLVNAIILTHSNEDCPVLQKCKDDYPLWFGAIPATLPEQDDNLEVILYAEKAATKRAPQKTGHSRGLSSSIWA
ncbi:hypothetical protein CGLO_07321 [Colletotrichum gloeosporioides Cg-14]|uniref:Uncharacterized protein n=1 Tax=Colletotrichum gloeosporioides (strain Cg-14) TaxID=1237896 RepID=T0KCA4_COLGC|nr:hypothetical protein CGLO_07321 [Colletotrichum gloeosporioides Cg-14]